MLTIAYFTSRKVPCIEWFAESLRLECKGDFSGIRIVIVDFWNQPLPDLDGFWVEEVQQAIPQRRDHFRALFEGCADYHHVAPKPNVWQGPHRRTKTHWWAMAGARNTAICLAPDGHIMMCDDLSVIVPGWLDAVRKAMDKPNFITVGGYKKVKDLLVEGGVIKSFTEFKEGVDSRWSIGSDDGPVECHGNLMFGYVLAPVEAFLSVNGYDERCDSLSFEDVITGIHLRKRGWMFQYYRSMLIYESEERHHDDGFVTKRSDYGVSPNDMSHAILAMAEHGKGWSPNYFDEGGIRVLRDKILAGEPFPICQIPAHHWYLGQELEQLRAPA